MAKNIPPELEDKFKRCKQHVMGQGHDESSAYAICYAAVVEGKADAMNTAQKAGFTLTEQDKQDIIDWWSAKFSMIAVKAVGDWEIEIRAVPYGVDSDGQLFDAGTDYMLDTFNSPAILYHHGVMPGKSAIQDKPVVIGKAVSVEKRSDGVYVRAILDKTLEFARRVWDAAKNGLAVASSDSISHLARLEVNGKRIMYEKNRKGRIAVWPLAGVSLWDNVDGNFQPASRNAIALPAMKAIYRDAGLPFPAIDTHGATPEADKAAKRAEIEKIKAKAREYLAKSKL